AGASEHALEPGEEVAAVRDRPALDEPPLVQPVAEETATRLGPLRLEQNAVGTGRSDHQRRAVARRAAGADVRAGAVAEGREPRLLRSDRRVRDLGQPPGAELELPQQLLVPRA